MFIQTNICFRVRKILAVLFLLYLFCESITGETLPETSIFIVPEASRIQSKTETLEIKSSESQEQILEKANATVANPDSDNINSETIAVDSFATSKPIVKSVADEVSQLATAKVVKYEGEGSSISVKFRGSTAFEPTYFFQGIPLQGIFNGAQNLDMLPSNLIGALTAWPDVPPWWLDSQGIAGAIDFSICPLQGCLYKDKGLEKNWKLATNIKSGSFGYRQLSLWGSAELNKDTNFMTGMEFTQSKENYLVTNTNNTVKIEDDIVEARSNNDFLKVGFGAHFEKVNVAKVGKISSDVMTSLEERGVPGEVGSNSIKRLQRRFNLISVATNKLFAASGTLFSVQLFGKNEFSKLFRFGEIEKLFIAKEVVADKVGVKILFNTPVDFVGAGNLAFSVSYAYDNFNKYQEATKPSLSAHKNEVNTNIFRSFLYAYSDASEFSLAADLRASFAYSEVNFFCVENSSDFLCNHNNFREFEKPMGGYSLAGQWRYGFITSFVRYSKAVRRPFLLEKYGSNYGVSYNLEIKAENSDKYEVGFLTKWNRFSCYYGKDFNLIFLERASPIASKYLNLENVTHLGCGSEASFSIYKYFTNTLVWNIDKSRFISKLYTRENYVPRAPLNDVRVLLGLNNYPVSLFTEKDRLNAYVSGQKQSNMFLDSANYVLLEVPLAINAGMNLGVNFFSGNFFQFVQVSLDGYNLLDDRNGVQRDIAGRLQTVEHLGYAGFPAPGRRFYFAVRGEF